MSFTRGELGRLGDRTLAVEVTRLSIRLPKALHLQLVKRARAERRTLQQVVARAVVDYLEKAQPGG